MLKLQKIEIENYGNLQKVDLKDLRRLNILIGPNNSGKTHILKAIEELNNLLLLLNVKRIYTGAYTEWTRRRNILKKKRTVSRSNFI